jgi:hypothetical protein
LNKENVVGTVLRQVRDWVAQQPALTTEEQRSRVIEQVAAQVKQTLPPTLEKETRQKAFPQKTPVKPPGKTGYDVYDIHVSIGPLNITVEAQEKPMRMPKPSAENETASVRPDWSSRLSRRFVKM